MKKWTLTKDELPDTIRPVIITWKNNDSHIIYQDIIDRHFIGVAHYHDGKWYWYSNVTEDLLGEYGECSFARFDSAIEVIAWMELPIPYEEKTSFQKLYEQKYMPIGNENLRRRREKRD